MRTIIFGYDARILDHDALIIAQIEEKKRCKGPQIEGRKRF